MGEKVIYLGKVIGVIEGDTFTTPRSEKHFFRLYHGFGLSKKVLGYLTNKSVTKVSIVYMKSINNFITYNIPLRLFFESPHAYTDKSNGVEDEQKIVSLPNEVL